MDRYQAFEAEFASARAAVSAGDHQTAEHHYSRAHILGQPRVGPHLRSHWALMALYLSHARWGDAAGQAWRFLLLVPGTLIGRLPSGNTGLSNVSAFQPMNVPPDIAAIIDGTRGGNG